MEQQEKLREEKTEKKGMIATPSLTQNIQKQQFHSLTIMLCDSQIMSKKQMSQPPPALKQPSANHSRNSEVSDEHTTTDSVIHNESVGVSQSLSELNEVIRLPVSWSCQVSDEIRYYEVYNVPCSCKQPLVVSHCLTIHSVWSWSLFVFNRSVDVHKCCVLKSIP